MSTRSGQRHHPYRNRRTSSGSGRSGARRRQRPTVSTQTTLMGSNEDPGGCIDLTANDTLDGDVIDLTDSFSATANNSAFDADPVVVISPTDVDNADAFRRENGYMRRPRPHATWDSDNEEAVIEVDSAPSSSSGTRSRSGRSNAAINVEDVSDDDLPNTPFDANRNANTSIASPEPVKITCPVCMETDTQIRRNRQLYSTVCGHIFCSACIKQAIDVQHMCPTCRKRLTKRQIHQIYL
ncbi:E3 ubiquitin-protein ligase RNF4-like [Littorina saxatilis]|uniref:RING-type domain-containing protein n=1 Tax=Littorina saxatilis TaxID=31220 RepID=A0AAN9BR49_9CAEN